MAKIELQSYDDRISVSKYKAAKQSALREHSFPNASQQVRRSGISL